MRDEVTGDEYVLDRTGQRIYAGDYVECVTNHRYSSIMRGERRRVRGVCDDCIIMTNEMSPRSTSPYRPDNFILAGRYHPFHYGYEGRDRRGNKFKSKEKKMTEPRCLYVAVRAFPGDTFEDIARRLKDAGDCRTPDVGPEPKWLAASTSYEHLKSVINERIRADPTEKWYVAGVTTVAEIATPPVTWRSL